MTEVTSISRILERKTYKMLKDMVKRDTGITLTMNEFRTAMRMCGYLPVNPQKIDCYYRISKKSPVLQDEWSY